VVNYSSSDLHSYEDAKPQRFWITTLTFWGHVTSSVTWPLDSASALSYWWSMMTMRLSRTVMEIWSLKVAFIPCEGPNVYCACPVSRDVVTCRWGGSKMTTYLEFPMPYCLFTIQVLWRYTMTIKSRL